MLLEIGRKLSGSRPTFWGSVKTCNCLLHVIYLLESVSTTRTDFSWLVLCSIFMHRTWWRVDQPTLVILITWNTDEWDRLAVWLSWLVSFRAHICVSFLWISTCNQEGTYLNISDHFFLSQEDTYLSISDYWLYWNNDSISRAGLKHPVVPISHQMTSISFKESKHLS